MVDALIKRTTLIVRDMNASSQWYEQVLGMTLYYGFKWQWNGGRQERRCYSFENIQV